MKAGFAFANPKRAILLIVLLVAVGGSFWSGSRYPELDQKAMMGGAIRLEDPLSFEALIPIQQGSPLWQRVTYSTINWIDTNKRGMAFGIALGVILLTLLKSLRSYRIASTLGNSALGVAIGAPLGLCVNCAAPLAKSLHHGGARLETTLVAMVSSPTLNVVVLTMTFSMFPAYMAATKVVGTLVFILVVIPLLSRFVFRRELADTIENAAAVHADAGLEQASETESWWQASTGVFRDLLASLWFIVRTTVPLMLLAGLLGAAVASIVPLDSVAKMGTGIVPLILLAVVGIFLPVPIAFDVVVCASLRAAGMEVSHVMVLLTTLGSFSIYSFFIVSTTLSRRLAWTLTGILTLMGILSGLAAGQYHAWQIDRMLDFYEDHASGSPSTGGLGAPAAAQGAGFSLRDWVPSATREAASFTTQVTRHEFQPRSAWEGKPFTKHEGRDFGLHRPILFSANEFWAPFLHGRGVAAGDVDGDGWTDVALATQEGVRLFANREGHFEPLPLPPHEELGALVVALVDVDNDGWLDVYFTVHNDANYYILNNGGDFSKGVLHRIANRGFVHTEALAFGDIDEDGDLDAILGNFFFGNGGPRPLSDVAANKLLVNHDGAFRESDLVTLEGMPGETFSTLLSDFDGDNHLDLIVSNDWQKPDYYYLGGGDGRFRMITKNDAIIPRSTWSTMSIDTADIDNDLNLEIYSAQIAGRSDEETNWVPRRPYDQYCSDVSHPEDRQACEQNLHLRSAIQLRPAMPPMGIELCDSIAGRYEGEKQVCMAMWLMQTAVAEKQPELCDRIKPDQPRAAMFCRNRFVYGPPIPQQEWADTIPQLMNDNVLLVKQPGGRFSDRAADFGINLTDWAWNSKFADLDNDTWQDLYVANGTWWFDRPQSTTVPTNVFFRNLQGREFEEQTEAFGLQDFTVVSAYTTLDIDNDGDLDLVTNAVNAPIRVYRNGERSHRAIAFELRDELANRFGIGSKITIYYGGAGELHQMRELKASGGFLSFDPPIAHFGLGQDEQVDRVEIVWSTGEVSSIEGPLPAGSKYTIKRLSQP